jgi:hypothetical protein
MSSPNLDRSFIEHSEFHLHGSSAPVISDLLYKSSHEFRAIALKKRLPLPVRNFKRKASFVRGQLYAELSDYRILN